MAKEKKKQIEELETALAELEEVENSEHHFGLKDSFIKKIKHLLDRDEFDAIHELCGDMSPEDMHELLMKLKPHRRKKLVDILEKEIDPETYPYLDKEVLNELLEQMSPSYIASIINELESDDALKIIEDLDEERRGSILRQLNSKLKKAVEEGLTFPEDSAGRIMQKEMVAVPIFWTVGKTIDYLRAAAENLPEKFYDIFVIDPMYKVVGEITLSKVLSSQRNAKIADIMSEECVTIPAEMDQHEVSILFRRKDLLSAAVVDDNKYLIGVITIDDIVDVIHEELEEEVLQLSGVSYTDIHQQVLSTANSRIVWLIVNMFTAIIVASVIGIFEATIEQIAVLAVLMPMVASMGGNAGGQTLAVTVRALANKDLSSVNSRQVIIKECLVGFINGIIFAIIMGSLVYLWTGNILIGLIMSSAILFNLTVAGFSGSAIPILMNKLGFDPAQSAVIFLTTTTDVIGFFAFLGLAKLLLF